MPDTKTDNSKTANANADAMTDKQAKEQRRKENAVKSKKERKAIRERLQAEVRAEPIILPRTENQSPRGLPLAFQEEIADIVLDRLADGQSLRAICRDPAMPDGSTIRKWLARNPDFARQYAIAREEQADAIFDETLFIADSVPPEAPNEEIQRARLRIDTRKWLAGKLRPKKYGDMLKHEVTGAGGGAITMQAVNVDHLDFDQRDALASMLEAVALPSPDQDDL